jgi:hypothetical protein
LLVAACDTGQVANLSIRSPSPGDSFTRDTIGVFGGRVAVVEVDVFSSGLAVTELLVEGRDVSDNRGSAEVDISGDVTLLVRGLDESGEVVASDSVTIVVADPPLAQCTQWLDLFGVDYQAGPAAPGIANPITASTPIAGVDYSLGGAPAAQIHADCTLIRSLAESAGAMRRRGVTEVQAAAIYDEGNEGQHALGTAIDVSGYVRDGGEPVSVATDWVLDLEGQSTCGAPTDSDADAWLHDVICAVRETGLWTVALSPNYDPDLAGLFHFDLTGGERNAVDTGPNNH